MAKITIIVAGDAEAGTTTVANHLGNALFMFGVRVSHRDRGPHQYRMGSAEKIKELAAQTRLEVEIVETSEAATPAPEPVGG